MGYIYSQSDVPISDGNDCVLDVLVSLLLDSRDAPVNFIWAWASKFVKRRLNGDDVSNMHLQVELTSSLLTPAVGAHHFYVFQVWRARPQPVRGPQRHLFADFLPSLAFVSTRQCFTPPEHSGLHHLDRSSWRTACVCGSHDQIADAGGQTGIHLLTNKMEEMGPGGHTSLKFSL